MLRSLLGKIFGGDVKVSLAAVPFKEAAAVWLDSRKPYLAQGTYQDYKIYVRTLGAFFQEMRLPEIDGEQIRAYQRMRLAKVGASAINKECSVLQQMLKRIGRWPEIGHDYQPLPLPKAERGRALSSQEYARLFRIARSNPRWEAAYLFASISANTTAGPKEVRTLRMRDVDLVERAIYINESGAKNVYRMRTIPLNEAAFAAAGRAMERAHELGCCLPEHYVFPFCPKRNTYDPERCQTSFRGAWREITYVADLHRFRMYDLRHHAITRLLENPQVSEETAEAIAGHISHKMKRRYSHIRMEYRRQAVEAISEERWKKKA